MSYFILFVCFNVHGGPTYMTAQFPDLKQCLHSAKVVDRKVYVAQAWCQEVKGKIK